MKVQQLIKDTCAIAAEDIGAAKADQIAQAAQKRYEALCTENASDSQRAPRPLLQAYLSWYCSI